MKKLMMSLLLAGFCCGANATTINFDQLTEPGTYGPNTTYGFVDSGFEFSVNMDAIDVSPTGDWWSNGVGSGHSGWFAAINNYAGDMVMTKQGGGSFSVVDLWLNGWQGEATYSVITGLLNGNVIGSVIANYSNPWQQFVLDFDGIDTLQISGGMFLVDDIQIKSSSVPESSGLVMLLMGMLSIGVIRRKILQDGSLSAR